MEVTIVRSKQVPQVSLNSKKIALCPKCQEQTHFYQSGNGHWMCESCGADIGTKEPSLRGDSKSNEKTWPTSYKCNFLEPGIVSYEDVGQGVALLKKESMDTWINSFKGKPVIIDHQNVSPVI